MLWQYDNGCHLTSSLVFFMPTNVFLAHYQKNKPINPPAGDGYSFREPRGFLSCFLVNASGYPWHIRLAQQIFVAPHNRSPNINPKLNLGLAAFFRYPNNEIVS